MSWSPSTARWQPATGVWRRWKTAPLLATGYSNLPDNATPPSPQHARFACRLRHRKRFRLKSDQQSIIVTGKFQGRHLLQTAHRSVDKLVDTTPLGRINVRSLKGYSDCPKIEQI